MKILPIIDASSIGIIGGADGPTAIFLATNIPTWLYLLGGALVLALIVLAGVALSSRHKNK